MSGSGRRERESNVKISAGDRATAKAWSTEWAALTDEERATRDEALARAVREADSG